jgi:hypothetical protein
LRAAATAATSPAVCLLRSVPLGKYWQQAVGILVGAALSGLCWSQKPVGFGTDFNGSPACQDPATAAGPAGGRRPRPNPKLNYPFEPAAGGEPMTRSQVGNRVFDFNVDGLAHIGMLLDLVADFQAMGLSNADLDPLLSSADGYVALLGQGCPQLTSE